MSQILNFNDFEILGQKLLERIDDLLKHFNIEYTDLGDRIEGNCIIHSSDNDNSLCIYKNDGFPVWKCWTGHCDEDYGIGLVGFTHGCLNVNRETNFKQAVDFIQDFLGGAEIKQSCPDKSDFIKIVHKMNGFAKPQEPMCTREYMLNSLEIPSPYFLSRGISGRTLTHFDVGDSLSQGKYLSNRAICPIYDVHNSLVGAAGRRVQEKTYLPKWLFSKGLKTSNILYGLNIAKQHILRRKSAILVEGCGDVLNLHDIGFDNAVGCFGAALKQGQIDILNSLGVLSVILIMDSDDAGQTAQQKIIEKCDRIFNIKQIRLDRGKDPGDLTKEDLERIVYAIKN
jgi:5S rRNA maturation endonuclease (ribonuclease M5)